MRQYLENDEIRPKSLLMTNNRKLNMRFRFFIVRFLMKRIMYSVQ